MKYRSVRSKATLLYYINRGSDVQLHYCEAPRHAVQLEVSYEL